MTSSARTAAKGMSVGTQETGVAMGHGSRTLYTSELPFCMAKSRTTNESFNIERGGDNPWPSILK